MNLKTWLKMPVIIEDKRDALTIALFILLVGMGLGYGWRMLQVEPIIDREISLLRTHVNALEGERRHLVYKIADLESRIKHMKGGNKK